MRKVLSILLKNNRLHGYLRRLYGESLEQIKATSTVELAVGEANPIQGRASDFDAMRLNLLVPALSTEHVFGGISTALSFLREAAIAAVDVRIILTEQVAFSYNDNPSFSDWEIYELKDDDGGGRRVIAAANRYNQTLAIGPNDYFIATAWWTAVSAKALQEQQQVLFNLKSKRKYIYLIQDYEPGFYPWSSRYALAESTYHNSENFIAVFNTSILQNFFINEGYKFFDHFHFEPVLHAGLRPFLPSVATERREKKILIYGRPTVARNAFPIIIMALQDWIKNNEISNWQFISAGETHPPIELGKGNQLISLGKLSIDAYAQELLSTYAGISLMISPHPSYPPLEMAAFGVQVITNNYGAKKLSLLSPNIHTVDWASPELISTILTKITSGYQSAPNLNANQIIESQFMENFCNTENAFFPIIRHILSRMQT